MNEYPFYAQVPKSKDAMQVQSPKIVPIQYIMYVLKLYALFFLFSEI